MSSMSNDKDGAGKPPLKGAPEPSTPKKPSVVIDLKATEIPIKDGKPQATAPVSGAGSGASASATQSKPTVAATGSTPAAGAVASARAPGATGPATGAGSSAAASATAGTSSSTAKPATSGSAPTAAPQTPAKPASVSSAATASATPAAKAVPDARKDAKPAAAAAAAPPKPTSAGGGGKSGFVSMLTHATAGIVGGLIALLAADTVGPQIGMPPNEATLTGKALQSRVAEIETKMEAARSTTAAPDPAVGQKLAVAERRLAELEKATADLAAVRQAQAKLAADTQALADTFAKAGDPNAAPTDSTTRLAKLEETLSLLSTAAGTDPQKGRIPQLAAVAGKVSDLETALTTGLAGVRRSVTAEIDARLGSLAEATETAKAGVQRIDRETTQLKAEANTSAKRQDDALLALRSDVDGQLKTVARAQDVSAAVTPVAAKITALETTVQTVVKNEADRKADAERVVLSLELGNLKRAIDRGQPFAGELDSVKRASGGKIDLSALDAAKSTGLPTLADLARDFRGLAHTIIEADRVPSEGGVVDRLMAGAKSIVRIRKTDAAADDKSSEATVARMEAALKAGQLQTVLDEAKKLSAAAIVPAKAWLDTVGARAQVDKVMAGVDDLLKKSLAVKGAQ